MPTGSIPKTSKPLYSGHAAVVPTCILRFESPVPFHVACSYCLSSFQIKRGDNIPSKKMYEEVLYFHLCMILERLSLLKTCFQKNYAKLALH